MDYEKLHKDTINKLHQMVNSGKITVETACGICADFVPESEDEKIRKEIIYHIQNCDDTIDEVTEKRMLAWLEAQGEQKAKYHDVCDKCVRQPTCQSDCFLQQDEQKNDWSEEDEANLRQTEYAVMKFFGGDCSLVGWLRKSLKERYTWEPSDEQMDALNDVISSRYIKYDVLSELWKDLKKLRKE